MAAARKVGDAIVLSKAERDDGVAMGSAATGGVNGLGVDVQFTLELFERGVSRLPLDLGELRNRKIERRRAVVGRDAHGEGAGRVRR